jgi:hypothetical protein
MAKDLPYFKFFCSEWNDGDITLENHESQGLFINICSYYWSNECDLHLDKLLKRFRGCDEIIGDLTAALLIKVNEDRTISISFLDEQREERLERSKIRSKGGKASAEKRRLAKIEQNTNNIPTEKQHVLDSCSTQVQVLRREEKREEEKIVIETPPQINSITEEVFLKRWCDARTYYDKLPTNIKRLTSYESMAFIDLKRDYTLIEFEKAMKGLFQQKTFPKTRLRPTHFLQREHFETYLTCFTTKEKLFDDNKYKKQIDRI